MQEVVSYIRNFAHKEWKFDNITMFIRFSTSKEKLKSLKSKMFSEEKIYHGCAIMNIFIYSYIHIHI